MFNDFTRQTTIKVNTSISAPTSDEAVNGNSLKSDVLMMDS